ncbi:MAG: hypothetical protein R3Y09_02250 [Clostridia bacterium]
MINKIKEIIKQDLALAKIECDKFRVKNLRVIENAIFKVIVFEIDDHSQEIDVIEQYLHGEFADGYIYYEVETGVFVVIFEKVLQECAKDWIDFAVSNDLPTFASGVNGLEFYFDKLI